MWIYQKNLEFPVNIKNPDPRMAKLLITQYGGADGNCLSKMEKMVAIYSKENLVIIRHRSISYAFCVYNKLYCTF